MDDLISRQWLMECVEEGWIKFDTQEDENRFVHLIRDIAPSAQTETSILTVTVAPDSEEIERVVRKIKDAPVMELPSAQSEWEHRTTRRVVKNSGSTNWYECLRCGTAVDLMDKFCRGCGRKFEEER